MSEYAKPVPSYRGIHRQTSLLSCTLTRDDLRTLFSRLQEKAKEAIEPQIADAVRPEDIDQEEWEIIKSKVRQAAVPTAVVIGVRGEQLVTTQQDGLADRHLPDRLVSVMIDSATLLRKTQNIEPLNRFTVRIDFTPPPNFNKYDPLSQPTPNDSMLDVIGPDENWVSGVYDLVQAFFDSRAAARRWLHSEVVFLAVQWLVVYPAILWTSYRAVDLLPSFLVAAHPVLTAGLYLYFAFLTFLLFRLLMLSARRMWPYVELQSNSRTLGRVTVAAVGTGVAGAVIYDLIKALLP